VIYPLK
jgi:hypothetical protein